MPKIKRYVKYYRNLAIIVLNTILLFLFLNLICYVVIVVREDYIASQKYYSDETLRQIYPQLSQDDINTLLKETKLLYHRYEPYVEYTESPFRGKFLNIDEKGFFRKIENQCSYPIDNKKYNIFIFGGSTTLGYGVGDNETIASQLQTVLRKNCSNVCVYNFGQGGYFSSPERALFEKLILEGQTPNMAIFIDGLNDFYFIDNNLLHTKRLAQYMARRLDFLDTYQYLPLFRAINYYLPKKEVKTTSLSQEGGINYSFNRLIGNQKMIKSLGDEFNVEIYFVIQPVPMYNYNLSYDIPYTQHDYKNGFGPHQRSAEGYSLLREYYSNLDKRRDVQNIIWLADIQMNETKNLYTDIVHYNTIFMGQIAQHISSSIVEGVC